MDKDISNEYAIRVAKAKIDVLASHVLMAAIEEALEPGDELRLSEFLTPLKANYDFILIDKLVNPGSSGSPAFCRGKIIGLTSGTINQTYKMGEKLINVPVGLGIIRTSNYILDLLNKND